MVGGGGSGRFLASPMRSKVIVSWALVGTPRRSVLNKASDISQADMQAKRTCEAQSPAAIQDTDGLAKLGNDI